jgi:hypothetical protein
MAYIEHEGEYLQAEGSNGPRNSWYARTSAIRTERTSVPVSSHEPDHRPDYLFADVGELERVRTRRRPKYHVDSATTAKDFPANDLSQAPFEQVAVHRRAAMSWHDDANPRKAERGSARPDREVPGPYDFPLLLNTSDVRASADALRPRVAQALLTRRRTWTEAAQSAASDPSCGDG